MPITFLVDAAKKTLFVECSGTFTFDDVRKFRTELVSDPEFSPDLSVLFDLTAVTEFQMSSAEIQQLAIDTPMGGEAKRAFVTRTKFDFGLMRMFSGYSDADPELVQVFDDLGEARRWLGLDVEGPGLENAQDP